MTGEELNGADGGEVEEGGTYRKSGCSRASDWTAARLCCLLSTYVLGASVNFAAFG